MFHNAKKYVRFSNLLRSDICLSSHYFFKEESNCINFYTADLRAQQPRRHRAVNTDRYVLTLIQLSDVSLLLFHYSKLITLSEQHSFKQRFYSYPFKYEAQTALFKDPVRTAQ